MRFEPVKPFDDEKILLCEALARSRLKFPAGIEREFMLFLRASQRTSAIALAAVALVILFLFAALDFQRFGTHLDKDSAKSLFLYGVFIPRWTCIAGLIAAIVILYSRRLGAITHWIVLAVFLLLGGTVFSTTATYSHLGLPNVISSCLLVVMAAFLPCTLTFRESAAVAGFLSISALIVTNWLLVMESVEQKWLFMVIVFFTFFLSCVSAFMREKAQRDQFLLRRLIDWEADHDSLTGLLNRRAFDEVSEKIIGQAQLDKVAISLAIIDIDFFKAYNDLYGHPAGDEALIKFSRILASCARRPEDLVVRLGGEEFGLVFYGDSMQSLEKRLQLCQKELAGAYISHEASMVSPYLTFSAGVAELSYSNESIADLYWRADVALYLAKKRGRNQVVGDITSPPPL